MQLSEWGSVARAILSAIGGIAVALGYMDEQTVGMVIGAIMTIGAALWGWKEKVQANKLIEKQENRISYLQGANYQPTKRPEV